jgi:hypothetical protein
VTTNAVLLKPVDARLLTAAQTPGGGMSHDPAWSRLDGDLTRRVHSWVGDWASGGLACDFVASFLDGPLDLFRGHVTFHLDALGGDVDDNATNVAEFAHFRLDGAFAVVAADARHGIGPNAHLPDLTPPRVG